MGSPIWGGLPARYVLGVLWGGYLQVAFGLFWGDRGDIELRGQSHVLYWYFDINNMCAHVCYCYSSAGHKKDMWGQIWDSTLQTNERNQDCKLLSFTLTSSMWWKKNWVAKRWLCWWYWCKYLFLKQCWNKHYLIHSRPSSLYIHAVSYFSNKIHNLTWETECWWWKFKQLFGLISFPKKPRIFINVRRHKWRNLDTISRASVKSRALQKIWEWAGALRCNKFYWRVTFYFKNIQEEMSFSSFDDCLTQLCSTCSQHYIYGNMTSIMFLIESILFKEP